MAPKTISASVPSPIGGWNARDVLSEMDETDAVTLINWFPSTSSVKLRKGFSQFSTGLVNQVESLMAYASPTSQKLFAAAGSSFFDVTSGGAVGAAVVTGLTNARWQHINVATSGGNFLYTVNGSDKPQLYNGTTWTAIDALSTPAITGVTTTNLIHVNLFKNRVWFVEKSSLKVWYLPTDSVGGAANALNFQSVARRGGYLVAMGTWTIDAGYGVDDLAVFVTSEGEVIVYRGTDPSSSTTWALVGVFQLGAPIGRRCLVKYAGDLLLICQDGVVPLAGELQSSRTNPRVALTDKIQLAISDAAASYGGSFGWQLLFYAKGNMVMLNVPVSLGSQEQFVMNTLTKSWCRFQGWAANCWEIFQDEPYFGGNGVVGRAWNTLSDNSTDINASAEQAFSYFGSRGLLKRFTMARPILLTNGTPSISISLNIDFSVVNSSSPLAFTPATYAVWDTAVWDAGLWGGSLSVQKSWQGVTGVGYCSSTKLQAAASGIEVEWVSTDMVMERGAIL